MKTIRKYRKHVSTLLIFIILSNAIIPNNALALTSGPASPEFSSFEPISTTNMVNEFTGSLTYNLPIIEIPGPNGGGYAMSLSYHSGTSPEEEASWVGYGWSLNPGVINRGLRGFPDDWNGKKVSYKNKTISNKTIALSGGVGFEIFSMSNASLNSTLRYNNFKGFGYCHQVGVNVAGIASLGYNINDGEGSFSYSINPVALLSKGIKKFRQEKNKGKEQENIESKKNLKEDRTNYFKSAKKRLLQEMKSTPERMGTGFLSSSYGIISHTEVSRPSMATNYSGNSVNVNVGLEGTPSMIQAGINVVSGLQYTTQTTHGAEKNAYGYMYTGEGSYGHMQDFHYEKESNYNKRDVFIGIPFNNADDFSVTGEGVCGGFRVYPKKIGTFSAANVISETSLLCEGVEVDLGLNNGVGAHVQAGSHELKVGEWGNGVTSKEFSFQGDTETDEPLFFRFNGDMGGSVLYSDNDDMEFSNAKANGIWGSKIFSVDGKTDADLESRSTRSSYIGYTLNKDMLELINGVAYKSYSKREDLNSLINRGEAAIKDQIGEFSIVNENGVRYNYALPVYSRRESSLSYGVDLGSDDENYYIGYKDITGNQEVKIGEIKETPYATSFLLTEILSPDYIDRTNDGPSPDDFGGYTKFVYNQYKGTRRKGSGNSSHWYKWRSPYNGLFINRNELSNIKDNMGSVSEGEKEIYYLDSIITKTHIAVFCKSLRDDACEASKDAYQVATNSSARGMNRMMKLDKIELYSRGDNPRLLKTVNFKYDYSIAKGVINNINTEEGSDSYSQSGKLTLKKVWTDYNGVYNPTISPYEFVYEYPNYVNNPYPEMYSSLQIDYFSENDQNPDYNPRNIDAWGNYQKNGAQRYERMQPWLNQNPSEDFDPAAWQLKQIKLPSGGEIHMQYEQNDYAYVQDQLAHIMTNLSSYSEFNRTAIIDLESFDMSLDEKEKLRELIHKYYVNGSKKMYFKFLYKLFGEGDPNIDDCTSEYIDGYVNIENVTVQNNHLVLTLKDGTYTLPQDVCEDYVKTQRAGNLNSNCGSPSFGGNALQILDQFINMVGNVVIPNNICLEMDPANSYLRIPSYRDKKGGGIRVKRLLMYDNGIGQGEPELYGNEYTYKYFNEEEQRWQSSGVASNEPQTIREENILVQPIDRLPQKLLSRIISGRDKKQVEGPIGESILPSPSISYSRVVVSNIHTGKTSPGYSVQEYYTFRDKFNNRPLINAQESRYSLLDNDAKDYLLLPIGFYNKVVNNIALSQGFLFEIMDFNGKPKTVESYSGSYYYDDTNHEEESNGACVSSQEYEYFNPREGLPVINKFSDLIGLESWGDLSRKNLGKEVDMTIAAKQILDHNNDQIYEFDATVGFLGIIPLPFFSLIPYINYNEAEMYLHATTKVIRYPAVLKSIKSVSNNVEHTVENKAFDPLTGKPLITMRTDGFFDSSGGPTGDDSFLVENGSITSYSIPAWQEYKQMGSMAENEKALFKSESNAINLSKISEEYYLSFTSTNPEDLSPQNTPLPIIGDLVEIKAKSHNETEPSSVKFVCNITNRMGNSYKLSETYYSINEDISFDDYLGEIDQFTIVRSANNNKLSAKSGTFAIYGDTLPKISADSLLSYKNSVRQAFAEKLNNNINNTFALSEIPGIEALLSVNSYDNILVDAEDQGVIKLFKDNQIADKIYDSNPHIGVFSIDTLTGKLIYIYDDGNLNNFVEVSGFDFNGDNLGRIEIQNVIASSQVEYSDSWSYDINNYYPMGSLPYNKYDKGEKGKYRVFKNYVYKAPVRNVLTDEALNFSSGMYTLEYFNINNRGFAPNDSDKWLCVSTNNLMSPDGNVLEEENIQGIKSVAKYGYHHTVPYLVSANADYNFVSFESFENIYRGMDGEFYLEDQIQVQTPYSLTDVDISINSRMSHTGNKSLNIGSNKDFIIKRLRDSQDFCDFLNSGKEMIVKVWVKKSSVEPNLYLHLQHYPNPFVEVNLIHPEFKKLVQVGNWTLYEAKLAIESTLNYQGGEFFIGIVNASSSSVLIDDLKIQPTDSKLTSYVYDNTTLKPIAIFDDEHFPLLFQYNSEGKLVRKLKETVEGIKTITETQYNNSVKQDRPVLE